jgi:hypothetical protein
LEEIITSLVDYYSTNVCTTVAKMRDHDDGEEPAPNKCQRQGRGKGKRSTEAQKNNDSDGNKKPIRTPKEVYNDLTKEEKAELKKTGEIDGYTISKGPNDKGVHTCVKTKSTKNPNKDSGCHVTGDTAEDEENGEVVSTGSSMMQCLTSYREVATMGIAKMINPLLWEQGQTKKLIVNFKVWQNLKM